jgi:hypothetical protein
MASDCESCTQGGCEYCLEDGVCMSAGQPCGGEVARSPGECEGDEGILPADADAGAEITAPAGETTATSSRE